MPTQSRSIPTAMLSWRFCLTSFGAGLPEARLFRPPRAWRASCSLGTWPRPWHWQVLMPVGEHRSAAQLSVSFPLSGGQRAHPGHCPPSVSTGVASEIPREGRRRKPKASHLVPLPPSSSSLSWSRSPPPSRSPPGQEGAGAWGWGSGEGGGTPQTLCLAPRKAAGGERGPRLGRYRSLTAGLVHHFFSLIKISMGEKLS